MSELQQYVLFVSSLGLSDWRLEALALLFRAFLHALYLLCFRLLVATDADLGSA